MMKAVEIFEIQEDNQLKIFRFGRMIIQGEDTYHAMCLVEREIQKPSNNNRVGGIAAGSVGNEFKYKNVLTGVPFGRQGFPNQSNLSLDHHSPPLTTSQPLTTSPPLTTLPSFTTVVYFAAVDYFATVDYFASVDYFATVRHFTTVRHLRYVYIKSKEAPAKDILKDLVEMCRGIFFKLVGISYMILLGVELLFACAFLAGEKPNNSTDGGQVCGYWSLDYQGGDKFLDATDDYVRHRLTKGVPLLFSDLSPQYNNAGKADILENLALGLEDSLKKTGFENGFDLHDFIFGPRKLLLKFVEDNYPLPEKPESHPAEPDVSFNDKMWKAAKCHSLSFKLFDVT
nr:N-terminal acetyltransferase A complex auxiliary subunit NAA15-like [Tanacetum cinerariifolium]